MGLRAHRLEGGLEAFEHHVGASARRLMQTSQIREEPHHGGGRLEDATVLLGD